MAVNSDCLLSIVALRPLSKLAQITPEIYGNHLYIDFHIFLKNNDDNNYNKNPVFP